MLGQFKNLSLGTKMSLGPVFLVVVLVGLAVYSLLLLERNEREERRHRRERGGDRETGTPRSDGHENAA